MSAFLCRIHTAGRPLEPAAARSLAARFGAAASTETAADGPFAAAASSTPGALRPVLARRGALIAAGDVRLDNRGEVAAWAGALPAGASDLDVVLAAYAARGPAMLGALLGDFSLVLWDGERRAATVMRDAFGVKPLFVAHGGDDLLVSSKLDALSSGRAADEEFVADFLVGGSTVGARTIWAGCRAAEPGEVLTVENGTVSSRRAWSPFDFEPAARADEREATETFRALFLDAVRVRAEGPGVWSQLSGGLDSSSVVSAVHHLATRGELARGLDGTVTVVDTLGDGDERRWSDAVLEQCGYRNEELVDFWAWQSDGLPPTRTDEPRSHYPFWARERRMVGLLKQAGARVVLSGQGSDHYLAGSWSYVTDLLAAGRVRQGLGELTRLSVAARRSFWTGLGRYGIHPFLPAALRLRTARGEDQVPAWIDAAFARRTGIGDRLPAIRRFAVRERRGSRFAHEVAMEVAGLTGFLEREPFGDGLEVRYPFLYRPLVEHALRLPPTLRIRNGLSKYVLRQAMRGILPEPIRTRRGKGGIDARILWTFNHEAPRLRRLLREPITAERGWVDANALRAAVEAARCGEVRNLPFLLCALALETWLAVREGRWTTEERTSSAA